MYEFYVSAQVNGAPRISDTENVARVVNAWAALPNSIRPELSAVTTAVGMWEGEREHSVIIRTDDETFDSNYAELIAEYLREYLSQDSVMVVTNEGQAIFNV